MNTIHQILYFALVWIVFMIVSFLVSIGFFKQPYNSLIMSIIFLSVNILLYNYFKQSFEKYRLLEITPEKKCELGTYTWGSCDSEQRRYCSDPSNLENIQSVTCCKGYRDGMPIRFEYTPESNDQWKNERCV